MSDSWLDQLERCALGDDALDALARGFGEYSSMLITEYWGYDSEYFIHRGDLVLEDGTAAMAALCALSDDAPVLVVDGDLWIRGTLDATRKLFGIAVAGDFHCAHLLAGSCAVSVGGDLRVEGLFTSWAAHGLVNADGVAYARFEDATDESYDLRFAPSVTSLSPLRDLLRPEAKSDDDFIRFIEANQNPFLVPFEEAVAIARDHADEPGRARAIAKKALEDNVLVADPDGNARRLTVDVPADAIPKMVFGLEHLEELRIPKGGVLSHEVRLLPKLRVLEGGPGLELPIEVGTMRALCELRTPHTLVPATARLLSGLRVLHCREGSPVLAHRDELGSLEELRVFGPGDEVEARVALAVEAHDAEPPAELDFGELVEAAEACIEDGDATQAIALFERALEQIPDDFSAALDLAGLLVCRDGDRACALVAPATDDRRYGGRAKAVATLVELRSLCGDGEGRAVKRYDEAFERFARLDFAAAADQWIDSVRADRTFADDAARRALLALFEWLGDSHPVTQEYRRALTQVL